MTQKLPSAVVAPRKRPLGSLLLPVAALLVAGWLGITNWAAGGSRITVHADEGHGIKSGDPLRFRGIHVGAVESVSLESDLSGVRIEVRLDPEAEALAREGSRFWIVRPQLGLDSVQGLETLVGARGVRLSGGQRQRLAAARAMVRQPELLVIDDLSSAVDVETEVELWDRLRERGRTIMAVSNRPLALRRADQVLEL